MKKYISGNNVLAPERKSNLPSKNEDYKKLKEAKKDRDYRLKQERIRKKKNAMQLISVVFVVGMILTFRYAAIFSMQKKLSSINKEIESINAKNESLKIDLLKHSSLQNVKSTSESKLSMALPDKSKAISVDLSKNNFKTIEEETSKNSFELLMTKVKKYLF